MRNGRAISLFFFVFLTPHTASNHYHGSRVRFGCPHFNYIHPRPPSALLSSPRKQYQFRTPNAIYRVPGISPDKFPSESARATTAGFCAAPVRRHQHANGRKGFVGGGGGGGVTVVIPLKSEYLVSYWHPGIPEHRPVRFQATAADPRRP